MKVRTLFVFYGGNLISNNYENKYNLLAIIQLLNPDNTISAHRMLAHAIGMTETIIYAALISKQTLVTTHVDKNHISVFTALFHKHIKLFGHFADILYHFAESLYVLAVLPYRFRNRGYGHIVFFNIFAYTRKPVRDLVSAFCNA